MLRHQVAVLAGDGIGPEVMDAALPAVEALGLPWDLLSAEIGWSCWCRGGDPIPAETWKITQRTQGALLGAVTSKPEPEAQQELDREFRDQGLVYRSPVVQLRRQYDLYANVRPAYNLLEETPRCDCVIVRENTEGLYAGIEKTGLSGDLWELVREHPNVRRAGPDATSIAVRVQTDFATDRILRYALDYAVEQQRDHVIFADKPSILRVNGQRLLERIASVTPDYPQVRLEVHNADAVAMRLVLEPQIFQVIVAENFVGDILSDVAAGITGGLGLAASGNIGDSWSFFEPVHGSAPDIAGKGIANPCAMLLSISGLAHHLGYRQEARALQAAVRTVVRQKNNVTPDLGGNATTAQCARAVIAEIG